MFLLRSPCCHIGCGLMLEEICGFTVNEVEMPELFG